MYIPPRITISIDSAIRWYCGGELSGWCESRARLRLNAECWYIEASNRYREEPTTESLVGLTASSKNPFVVVVEHDHVVCCEWR